MSQTTFDPGQSPDVPEHQVGTTGWPDDVPPNQHGDVHYRLEGQPRRIKWAERRIAVCFTIPIFAALGLAITYVKGGQPQAEGILLFLSLAPLALGLVLWARDLLPGLDVTDSRHVREAVSPLEERDGLESAFDRGESAILRRSFLLKILGLAGGLFGVAAIFPLGFLGARPLGKYLDHTSWTPGAKLVDDDGRVIKVGDLEVNGILTVFPEGHTDDAVAQTILINIGNLPFEIKKGRAGWEQDGLVAFSKVCTHAGCPVGLYRVSSHQLICPCHQSTFDVLKACEPVFGPAPRSLPQLALAVDSDGNLIAQHDYTEPVGPGFWNRG
jgi:ubiquinol-cytochrome c reductase iron-sulfur subunit